MGEVSSARPLVLGLRKEFPDARIVCSTTTATGLLLAKTLLKDQVDAIFPSPLDIGPVIAVFLRLIRPDLYILVETDFWPNLLTALNKNTIPAILVNGRISERLIPSLPAGRFFSVPFSDRSTISACRPIRTGSIWNGSASIPSSCTVSAISNSTR